MLPPFLSFFRSFPCSSVGTQSDRSSGQDFRTLERLELLPRRSVGARENALWIRDWKGAPLFDPPLPNPSPSGEEGLRVLIPGIFVSIRGSCFWPGALAAGVGELREPS